MARVSIPLFVLAIVPLTAAQAQVSAADKAVASGSPVTAVGVPLPLSGSETVVANGNGCGTLQPKPPNAAALASLKKYNWYGACRFGLADGAGIDRATDAASDYYTESRYRYGISLNGPGVSWYKSNGSWTRSDYERYGSPDRSDSLYFSDWSDQPYALDSQGLPAKYRSITVGLSPTSTFYYIDNIEFCFGGPLKAQDLQSFPSDEQTSAGAICSSDQWGHFHTIKYEKWQSLPDMAAFPDGQKIHTLETRNFLCASMSDCRSAWNKALSAEWPRIQSMKAELIAAQNAYVAGLEARMAPLEVAYAAKLARFAAARHPTAKPSARKKR